MKVLTIFSFFLFFSISTHAYTKKRIENPKFNWVEILNKKVDHGHGPMGIDIMWISSNGKPSKDNICSIGGNVRSSLKIIGELSDGEYIFEYERDGIAYGAPCPTGVFFKAKLEDIL